MTDLPQTALAFAKECMRWADPAQLNPTSFYDAGRDMVDAPLLHPADLNAVLDAVRGWCDRNEASVEIGYHGFIPGEWEVLAITAASVETVQAVDLAHALMAACVEAARKLNRPQP